MNSDNPSYSYPMSADEEWHPQGRIGASDMDAIVAAAAATARASFPPSALDSAGEPPVRVGAPFQRTQQQRRKSCQNAVVAKRRSSAKFARRSSATSVASSAASSNATTMGGCFAKPFPEKLMEMMTLTTSDPTSDNFSDSIEWLPHGKSFTIKDPEKFTKDVLPVHFKQSKFSSFTRKLYRWGFRQITKGPDANSYFHESFLRDDPESASNLKCNYSQKELQVQAENSAAAAARRRASTGVPPGTSSHHPGRRASTGVPAPAPAHQRLPKRGSVQAVRRASVQMLASQSSINEDEDDEAAVMAQIEWAAAAMGTSSPGATMAPASPSLDAAAQRAIMRRGSSLGMPSLRSSLISSSRRSSLLGRSSTRSSMSSSVGSGYNNQGEVCYGGNREVPNSITLGDSAMSLGLDGLGLGGSVATPANELPQGASQGLTGSIGLHNGQVPGSSDAAALSVQQLLAKQHEMEDAILAMEESDIRRRRQQLAEERQKLGLMSGSWCDSNFTAAAASAGMGGGVAAPPRRPVGPGDGRTHPMGLGNDFPGVSMAQHNNPALQGTQAKYQQVQGQMALSNYNQSLTHSSNGFNTAA